MNQLGRDVLRAAALEGVRQIRGQYTNGDGGRCALGLLGWDVVDVTTTYDLGHPVEKCPICSGTSLGALQGFRLTEEGLIVHLNDDHELDFLGIAEKMPVSEEK